MSRSRPKTPGWAALDLKKQKADNETHSDPYPPISTNIGTLHPCQNPTTNGDPPGRSFSSVLSRAASVPNFMAAKDDDLDLHITDIPSFPNLNTITDISDQVENRVPHICKKLKELHSWADENLIEDVVAAVNHDFDKASVLLKEMVIPGILEDMKETRFEDNIEEACLANTIPENMGLHLETTMLLDDNVPLGLMIDHLSSIPMEPEWEDDDMYIVHRKEAIRATRLASRHSKAATEAYLRGDHVAAQEFSVKAREEWSNVDKLNAKAAAEILTIRNNKNDNWKLDLHGLHAAEAVQALLQHLLKIESRDDHKASSTQAASFESINCLDAQKSDKQQQPSRPRLLEVITGKGNHSRGEAALPVAIKSFLSEKGYYYYEARAGVFMVQPKFRHL